MTRVFSPSIEIHVSSEDLEAALIADARTGLSAQEKWLDPVWFYDERGSRLFEEITRLDEYYPTRAERRILEAHSSQIAALAGADTLVELGAGTCEKTRLLLDALRSSGELRRYVPLDVSEATLWAAASDLARDYAGLHVHAVVADFHRHLDRLPTGGKRLIAFLGGTIGNLTPGQRRRFLFDLECNMSRDDWLLLGTDLVKDRERLVSAYDDATGVTAQFNLNVLSVLNRELGADFRPELFEHVALWNEEERWIEMRLRSCTDQVVRIPGLDLEIAFERDEELRTEISAKFSAETVESELVEGGFVVEAMWDQPDGDFLLTLARPYC